ncbi:MAG: ABC transporter permease [Clostridiales bacterium]|jgi:ABC-2 type transport system permease protein|nr:ABC transporter permease [Clostridiales bacterium]
MTKIFNADAYKFRKNIASWLLPTAAVVAALVTAVFMYFIDHGLTVEGGEAVSTLDVFGFNPAGAMGAYALSSISNLFAILAVVFSGLFISSEFAGGTIRNAICIGKSRIKVYLSKLVMCGIMLLIIMLAAAVGFIVIFTVMYGFGDGSGFLADSLKVFGLQFLYHLTYASLACMLAFLIQNIVTSVSVGIFCTIFSGVLTDVFTAFDGLGWLARFMPNYYITRLLDNVTNMGFIIQSIAACVMFIAITSIIGCSVFKERDIN